METNWIAQMAWADESVTGFVDIAREQSDLTTPELFENILTNMKTVPDKDIRIMLTAMLATAIQKLARKAE